MGRPAELKDRVRLTVFLEREELAAIQARAAAEDVSASRFARRVLLTAVARRKEK